MASSKIVVIGGKDSLNKDSEVISVFDKASLKWETQAAKLPEVFRDCCMTRLPSGKFLAVCATTFAHGQECYLLTITPVTAEHAALAAKVAPLDPGFVAAFASNRFILEYTRVTDFPSSSDKIPQYCSALFTRKTDGKAIAYVQRYNDQSVYVFSEATNKWTKGGETPNKDWSYCPSLAVMGDGKILCLTRQKYYDTVDTCQTYDPAQELWSPFPQMLARRWEGHAAVTLPNGDVLVTGGISDEKIVADCELYEATEKRWIHVASMRTPRCEHRLVQVDDNTVMAIGGRNGDRLTSCEFYDVQTRAWRPAPDAPAVQHYGVPIALN